MLQKKRKETTKFSPILEKKITEILVTNGRSFEPFVRTFCYKGENVAKNHLGSLVGVFEVSERTEDSAYIVNFLASVAKKEYFAQGKRGPIESFESALHKINIALAELVKHGNVEWLGKLHGALGILEKNNLHFSATGSGRILLMRNGAFTDISVGLASTESALHPMKTFAEVSSGHLEAADRLLFTTPEIFRLFSLEELGKNALRLEERFPQFLKTALINELDIAGVVYASFSEVPHIVPSEAVQIIPNKPEETPTLANVFSEQAFLTPLREESPPPEQEMSSSGEKNEYIDSKTGHIYIQGETPNEKSTHPFWQKAGLQFEEFRTQIRSLSGSRRRFFRKARKQGLIALDAAREKGLVGVRKGWRGIRRRLPGKSSSPVPGPAPLAPETIRKESFPEKRREGESFVLAQKPEESPSHRPWLLKEKTSESLSQTLSQPKMDGSNALDRAASRAAQLAIHCQKRIIPLFKKLLPFLGIIGGRAAHWSLLSFRKTYTAYREQTKRARLGILVGSLLLITLGISGIWFLGSKSEKSTETSPVSPEGNIADASLIPQGERKAALAGTAVPLANREEKILKPLFLGKSLFLITQNGILRVADNTFYPVPSDTGAVLLATAMEDLQLLFLSTEKKGLLSFSPITRSYTSSTLGLPENAVLGDMGAYLTYLYILESATDQIYRFPRATGGFGERVLWLKEAVPLEKNSRMAVNESIFVSTTPASLESYFQGRKVRSLEMPATPLEIQAVFTQPGLGRVYALDQKNQRLLIWNTEGVLERQFFSEEFGRATAISVNNESTEAYAATEHELLLVPLTDSLP